MSLNVIKTLFLFIHILDLFQGYHSSRCTLTQLEKIVVGMHEKSAHIIKHLQQQLFEPKPIQTSNNPSIAIPLANSCGSDDWQPYKDIKCLSNFDSTSHLDYEGAVKLCQSKDGFGSPIIIRSHEEQEWVADLLYNTYKIKDNVWLGGELSEEGLKITWNDNSTTEYTHWDTGYPQAKNDSICVQMNPGGTEPGKWENVPCTKSNQVVCEKSQTISHNVDELKKLVEDLKQKNMNDIADVKQKIKDMPIYEVTADICPVGYVYEQFYKTALNPQQLWPNYEWKVVFENALGVTIWRRMK